MTEREKKLVESLKAMLGWALYGEDCDYWYFTEDQAPGFEQDIKTAKATLVEIEGNKA